MIGKQFELFCGLFPTRWLLFFPVAKFCNFTTVLPPSLYFLFFDILFFFQSPCISPYLKCLLNYSSRSFMPFSLTLITLTDFNLFYVCVQGKRCGFISILSHVDFQFNVHGVLKRPHPPQIMGLINLSKTGWLLLWEHLFWFSILVHWPMCLF